MPVDVTHIESWAVAITPDDGEEWPVIEGGAGRADVQPDLILLQVIPGQPLGVTGSGRRKRRDGTIGSLRVNAPWRRTEDLPEWAAKLVASALGQHELLGLSRMAEHAVAPLLGTVRDRFGHPRSRVQPGDYPLSGLCHTCHEPVACSSFDAGWAHS